MRRYSFSPNAEADMPPSRGGSIRARTASRRVTVKRQTDASIMPSLPPTVSADKSRPTAISGTSRGAAASNAKPNGRAPTIAVLPRRNAAAASAAPSGREGSSAFAAFTIRAPVFFQRPASRAPTSDAGFIFSFLSPCPFIFNIPSFFRERGFGYYYSLKYRKIMSNHVHRIRYPAIPQIFCSRN